jgi:hypothetical protein
MADEEEYSTLKIKNHSTKSYTKTFYNKDGNIDVIELYDTLNILLKHYDFVYDNQGRIIEKNFTNKSGFKIRIETYEYDSLDRWVGTIFYDSLDKEKNIETRMYKGNTVTIINSKLNGMKTVMQYKKNQIVVETFYPNGNTYYKSVKKIDGDNTISTQEYINELGRKWAVRYARNNAYEHYFELKLNKGSSITNSKINYTIDTKSDTIQIKTISYRLNTLNKKGERKTEKVEEFVYDAMGNYITKTVYYNGTAAYKTMREIEYY